ncbi:hypothetical protein BDN72DRAFT_76145 [Pluteus cervinus]|uniref:Uncharacterized protein n=1 Tax=Pluteus cervinus TaxID=181527 RepID=A0ACD3APZ1_9AGAR|nr:hypothetical protein BDN72DRAFT_76145 [Pluteus cervinus]
MKDISSQRYRNISVAGKTQRQQQVHKANQMVAVGHSARSTNYGFIVLQSDITTHFWYALIFRPINHIPHFLAFTIMPSKFVRLPSKYAIAATKKYARQSRQDEHTLRDAPFVGSPQDMQPGYCRISAEYCEANGPLPSSSNNTLDNSISRPKRCVVNATPDRLSTLVWDKSQTTNPWLVIPELPSAEYITDLRIDMTVSDDIFKFRQQTPTFLLAHTPTATFARLRCLILVGLEGNFNLVPFRWDISCPVLEELWLQDRHTARDVCAILLGCPKLKNLTVSTIVDASGSSTGEIRHRTLENLILVSNIPLAPILKSLKLASLKTLELWMMPGVACDTTSPEALFQSVRHISGQEYWNLGLNFYVSQDIILDHFGNSSISVTRMT